jgi:hypothetical protein
MLYPLSYKDIFCLKKEVNGASLRPPGPQPDALSTELQAHYIYPLIRRLTKQAHLFQIEKAVEIQAYPH